MKLVNILLGITIISVIVGCTPEEKNEVILSLAKAKYLCQDERDLQSLHKKKGGWIIVCNNLTRINLSDDDFNSISHPDVNKYFEELNKVSNKSIKDLRKFKTQQK